MHDSRTPSPASELGWPQLARRIRSIEDDLESVRRWLEGLEHRYDMAGDNDGRFIAADAAGNVGAARGALSHLAWRIERVLGMTWEGRQP